MSEAAIKPITTDRALKALKPSEDKDRYNRKISIKGIAGATLLIRVTRNGAKTFYSRFSLAGKRIDVKVGSYPAISLKEAINKHNEYYALTERGIDPRIEARSEKAKRETELTLDQLMSRWLEHREQSGELKPRTIRDDRWRWGKYLVKPLGHIKLTDITRQHLATALDATRKHSRDETRKSLNMLNGCLDYALSRQLIEENPARLLKPKDFAASPGKPRDRWLSITELRLLWKYLDSDQHQTSFHLINLIKLALLTGARRGELAGMSWGEVDLSQSTWTLPAERSKNAHSHIFYLHPLAVDLLTEMLAVTGHTQYVFNAPNNPEDKPIQPDTATRATSRISKALKAENVEHFSLHDLRRTCASHWVDTLGTDSRLAELMLNHLPADRLVRTYQQGKQLDRQKTTWLRWGDLISGRVIQDADNVVSLKTGND